MLQLWIGIFERAEHGHQTRSCWENRFAKRSVVLEIACPDRSFPLRIVNQIKEYLDFSQSGDTAEGAQEAFDLILWAE